MEFREPPIQKKGKQSEHWIHVANTLKEKRGEWAFVGDYSPAIATFMRRGVYKAFLPIGYEDDPRIYMRQHWEFTVRTNGSDRRVDLYVRWLG